MTQRQTDESSRYSRMTSENQHISRQLSPLIILLLLGILGILIFNLSLYTKVATLQSRTQSLLEKVNQLERESNVKISNLVRKTESWTVPIKRIKRNEERMTVASKIISELILLVGSIKNDFETKMKEVLSEEITKIPDRLLTLNKTTEILSIDIEDKWVLVQRTTVAFVITVLSLCGGLLYSRKHKIDDIEKKIRYLTENKDKPSLQYESLNIVEQIKRRQPEELENKFCVISFSHETHNKHRRITRPSVERRLRIKKMNEADFVVTNDKSVLKIPHCKVILVFVDHNQKDVILETPGEDEEDIKLLTVQACRKKGADVFVIYVGDEGSESLMAGCLYNPQLTTVAEHFELKQIEQRNRVITCHEKFTITQREKVAQAIA
ncbi:uncharacterized protein LOC143079077 [Mytilus galloprovincialis]|uniref:uncharacterized protein LOC143079077 n=1 Tax=Mytilus galloprovincialis TaxID=29158 RepID=UPI003F7B7058